MVSHVNGSDSFKQTTGSPSTGALSLCALLQACSPGFALTLSYFNLHPPHSLRLLYLRLLPFASCSASHDTTGPSLPGTLIGKTCGPANGTPGGGARWRTGLRRSRGKLTFVMIRLFGLSPNLSLHPSGVHPLPSRLRLIPRIELPLMCCLNHAHRTLCALIHLVLLT